MDKQILREVALRELNLFIDEIVNVREFFDGKAFVMLPVNIHKDMVNLKHLEHLSSIVADGQLDGMDKGYTITEAYEGQKL